jgi:ribosome maturation factor RimP
LALPILAETGLELVELALKGSGNRQVLRLSIDRAGTQGVGLEDCQRVSRGLSPLLDEAESISTSYVLEVSSPGIDRPIRTAEDIRRNTGRRVVVTARDATGQQRSYRGTLLGSETEQLRLAQEPEGEIRIPLEKVVNARQDASS